MAITYIDNIQRDQTKQIAVTFKNASAAVTDPTTVTFTFRAPTGTVTTYTNGVDSQLVKDSTGVYHVNLTCSSAGAWHCVFKGVGVVNQAAYVTLYVGPDNAQ